MEPARARELLTPGDVRRLLDEHRLAPRRSAGQNFVIDPNTVRKVVRDAGVTPDDLVVEVGPGLGSLTLALAAHAGRVIAVEVDSGLVRALAEVLGDTPNVTVVHDDVLAVDLDELTGGEPARLIANLPYAIATPLVFHALESRSITDLHVMVQREVGERWAAGVGDPQYGAVSAKLALLADVRVVADVPRTVFHPVPNVDSVTVAVRRRPDAPTGAERRHLTAVIDAAFAHRRKTIRNSLRRDLGEAEVDEALAAAEIDPGSRAERVEPERFRALASALPVGSM